jgi:hypothetical protein
MRRATVYSRSTSSPQTPVESRAKPTWRILYTAYERRLLLGAAVLLALLALAPYFTGSPAGMPPF